MAISSTPTGYSNGCTGRLAAAITTTTSTGITVTADTVKSPAGTGAVTWTTGNQIWKISRKTRTNTEVEYIGVESLSQSGTAITTGTVIRYLSPTDGTSFATVGNGLSFPAGSVVELVWDVRHAEQTVFKNNTQTFTGDNTFSGAITMSGTTKTLQVAQMTTTQRDAVASPANGMIIYNTSTGVMNQYIGGAWTTFASGTVSNAADTASGKVDIATTAEIAALTANDATSGAPNALTTGVVSITTATSGKIPALNTGGKVDVAIGGTGVASPTSGNLLLGAGSSAMTLLAPGTSGNVVTSNGSTFTSTAPVQSVTLVKSNTADSSAAGTSTTSQVNFDVNYSIPSASWVAGTIFKVDCVFRIVLNNSDVCALAVRLGTTNVFTNSITNEVAGVRSCPVFFSGFIKCISTGVSGTYVKWGEWKIPENFSDTVVGTAGELQLDSNWTADTSTDTTSQTVTVDMTSAITLQASVQYTGSSANNAARLQRLIVQNISL